MSSEPSPSSTITLRCGRLRAIPSPMLETRPSVRLRKLPSLGCKSYHSTVAPPALATTNASPTLPAMAFRQSIRFISGLALEEVAIEQHCDGSSGVHGQHGGAGDRAHHGLPVAQDVVTDAERVQHRLGDVPYSGEISGVDVTGIIDDEQRWDAELQRRRGQTVGAIEKSAILHDQCRGLSR